MTAHTYRFRDPLFFPPLPASALTGTDEGVWVEHPGLPVTHLRIPPSFHVYPSGSSIFSALDTRPPVIYPPAFALARNNVTLTGYRTVLGEDGTFCTDEAFVDPVMLGGALNRLSFPDEFNNEATGLVKTSVDDEFFFDLRNRSIIEQSGPIVLLCSTEPSNYGSFLFRILPKLRTLRNAGLDHLPVMVPIYAQSMADFLLLSGIDESRIVRHYANAVYKINRAIVLSLRNSQAYLDDESLAYFTYMRNTYGVPSQGRRLYLTRRSLGAASNAAQTRVMRNESEVIEALESHGFEIVEPSRLSAIEQIRLFSSASIVVGPSGSAMFNVVFCHPGTKLVDIESEPHWIHAHMCLFGSLGLDYGIFEGSADDRNFGVAHKPFTVDVEALMRRVLDFEREPHRFLE
jgi:Glycosyltransferase 61